MEPHLHKSQLGFIKNGECHMHIQGASEDLKTAKQEKEHYPLAGFLFIDFQ